VTVLNQNKATEKTKRREAEDDEEDVMELREENHPLMRPGAMPRNVEGSNGQWWSQMVEDDLRDGNRSPGSVESEDDELDE
jgi:hypothetical protein